MPLRRGGRIDIVKASPDFAARSFAAIYLVILSFDRLGDPFKVRKKIADWTRTTRFYFPAART